MTDHDDIDARLEKLTRATARIAPRADFSARVMRATADRAPEISWWGELPKAGFRLLPVAALVAALGITWAATNAGAVDDAIASTPDDVTELEW
ncbi:MAG TPA: hypothetical protein VF316_12085 [Polyangiaceae bacterium]